METKIHLGILSPIQKKLLLRLIFPSKDYYLAGGTALSLYFAHRTSLDFDFYTPKKFRREKIYNILKTMFPEEDITVTLLQDNTFTGVIWGVNISFFYYPYSLLRPLTKTANIYLSSREDIAAMKIVAIIQRPAKRDYIDLYYLLKQFSLEQIFGFCLKKFPNFNPYLALRAISYFEDIEKESLSERGIKVLDKHFSWKEVKQEIFEKVKEIQLKKLK